MHPLQLLLQSLKQVVQVKESETLSTSNSSLCQSIIDDANYSFSTLVDELRGVKIEVSNLHYVMDLLVNKVEEGKKNLLNIFERFPKSKLEGIKMLFVWEPPPPKCSPHTYPHGFFVLWPFARGTY
jgi:flagellar biosynthesis component FlhA